MLFTVLEASDNGLLRVVYIVSTLLLIIFPFHHFFCSYYHELFLRGRPDLCRQMVRTRIKGNGMKAASSPSTEPNFYTMSFCEGEGVELNHVNCAVESGNDNHSDSGGSVMETTIDVPTSLTMSPLMIEQVDPLFPESEFPALVSPDSSPRQSSQKRRVSMDYPDLLLMPPNLKDRHGDCFPTLTPSTSASDCSDDDLTLPSSGDPVYFEGHMFRYMDHLDLHSSIQEPYDPFAEFSVQSIASI